MTKKKTLEEYKQELIGKKFTRLTVLDVQINYRKSIGQKNGFSALCKCDCGNIKTIFIHCLLKGTTTSCGCLQKEKAKNNIKQALKWNEEHPEEMKVIRDKGVSSMLQWQQEHPEEAREQKLKAVNNALEWREKHPEKCKDYLNQAHQWQKEHAEEFAKSLENNIKQALKWNEEHPEEMKVIRDKGVSSMLRWQQEHSNYMIKQRKESIKKAQQWNKDNPIESINRIQVGRREELIKNISLEEKEIYDYLISLGYSIERQILLEGHYFDFRINNFLIEYNGSVYHCSEYNNIENPNAKLSMQNFKPCEYHKELRELANRNGLSLIQIWDYDWINRKEFVQKLLKEQLNNIANYKYYLDENNLLNNDYGFNIEGEQVEPKGFWISTNNPKIRVTENYVKGKVLVYNSGYTKV